MTPEGWNMSSTVPWESLWKQLAGPIALIDLQGRHVDVNPAMCRLLGYERERLLELLPVEVTHQDDYALAEETIRDLVVGRIDSFSAEKRLLRADGDVILVLVTSSLLRASDGSTLLIASQFHDITDRYGAELLWRRTLGDAPIGMALMDLEGYCTEVNARLCELVGYGRGELLGRRSSELVYEGDKEQVDSLYPQFRAGRTESANLELCLRHRDGHPFWTLARIGVVQGLDDRPAYVVSQYEPLGDDAQVDEGRLAELTRMALHDPLTGLANRSLLLDRFHQELTKLPEQGGVLAVLMIDLDGFKPINDRYGHNAGDRILQAAAQEVSSAVRSSDTVARIGGDEFVVLAVLAEPAQAEELRARVAQQLNSATPDPEQRVRLGASVGLTTTRDPSVTPHDLLAGADRDMYARKFARSH
ncbi:diguanylate cyclase [Actinopolyspora saharensis]|uniref:diguanylate cyclase n=1 Tax=Actinopolyspora saharensis TaxID=995062 RepID=UPI003F662490